MHPICSEFSKLDKKSYKESQIRVKDGKNKNKRLH